MNFLLILFINLPFQTLTVQISSKSLPFLQLQPPAYSVLPTPARLPLQNLESICSSESLHTLYFVFIFFIVNCQSYTEKYVKYIYLYNVLTHIHLNNYEINLYITNTQAMK